MDLSYMLNNDGDSSDQPMRHDASTQPQPLPTISAGAFTRAHSPTNRNFIAHRGFKSPVSPPSHLPLHHPSHARPDRGHGSSFSGPDYATAAYAASVTARSRSPIPPVPPIAIPQPYRHSSTSSQYLMSPSQITPTHPASSASAPLLYHQESFGHLVPPTPNQASSTQHGTTTIYLPPPIHVSASVLATPAHHSPVASKQHLPPSNAPTNALSQLSLSLSQAPPATSHLSSVSAASGMPTSPSYTTTQTLALDNCALIDSDVDGTTAHVKPLLKQPPSHLPPDGESNLTPPLHPALEHRRVACHAASDHDNTSISPRTRPASMYQTPVEVDSPAAKRKLSFVDDVEDVRDAQRPAVDVNGAAIPKHLASDARRTSDLPLLKHVYRDGPPRFARICEELAEIPEVCWSLKAYREYKRTGKRGPALRPASDAAVAKIDTPKVATVAMTAPAAAAPATVPTTAPAIGSAWPEGASRVPWDPSLRGVVTLVSGLSHQVADFLFKNVIAHPQRQDILAQGIQFEVEAKLGTLVNYVTQQRVFLPIMNETVLMEPHEAEARRQRPSDFPYRFRFQSSISEAEHQSVNQLMNKLVMETEPRNPHRDPVRLPIVYSHLKQTDSFFDLPPDQHLPAYMEADRGSCQVRLSRDANGNVIAAIVKKKLVHLHVHFPIYSRDCRLSVNLEMPYVGPIPDIPARGDILERRKDRLSYQQGVFQLDLTQVTSIQPPSRQAQAQSSRDHELEIELDGEQLLRFGDEAQNGNPGPYTGMIDALLDNIRLAAHTCAQCYE